MKLDHAFQQFLQRFMKLYHFFKQFQHNFTFADENLTLYKKYYHNMLKPKIRPKNQNNSGEMISRKLDEAHGCF